MNKAIDWVIGKAVTLVKAAGKAIGGLFGLYAALMMSYFTDSLPQGLSPLLLLSRITPLHLGGIGVLELCWFARWSALSTL